MKDPIIKIYTDGSCHTQLLIGAWAALVFTGEKKTILKGVETNTTHNRMELLAVIKAIEMLDANGLKDEVLNIYSDSQYVVNLSARRDKLEAKNFISNKGTPIQNADLVQTLLAQIATHQINFIKVKAHQKPNGTENFNREVDKIVRNLVRENAGKND
ncbi:MAG: ribonuclease H [Bacteroidota bacterium]|nr:ribonuclease H [Bacteroidota bacterium]